MDWYRREHPLWMTCTFFQFMKYQAKKLFDTLFSFWEQQGIIKKFNASINYFDTICERDLPPPSTLSRYYCEPPSASIFFSNFNVFTIEKRVFCNAIPQPEKSSQSKKLFVLKNLVHSEWITFTAKHAISHIFLKISAILKNQCYSTDGKCVSAFNTNRLRLQQPMLIMTWHILKVILDTYPIINRDTF